ncbi:hypothetical protein GCM10023190_22490 [Enteractinococcus fodinae]|uniref:N-acetyltransferase domain-containing protein n=1 Tax=Enteractinococcus fodinae TaxID=684663 RepID=A0ABU2B6J1_9MICC|nr:hypothetical protein [Enteractinococcus fodinae]
MRYIERKNSVVYKFTGPTPPPIDLPAGYGWSRISHECLDKFFAPKMQDWRLKTYRKLLDKGHIGFLIHDQVEWAAVQWLSTPESPGPDHLPTRISQGKFWCFNEHTREEHRRLGLWRALKSIGVRYIRSTSDCQGMTIYSDTGVENLASRKAHQNFGFEPAGTIDRLTIVIPKVTALNWGAWAQEQVHPPR